MLRVKNLLNSENPQSFMMPYTYICTLGGFFPLNIFEANLNLHYLNFRVLL